MKGKHLYRLVLWCASTFGVLCFIFANSLTPAAASSEESRSVLDLLLSFFPAITHRIVRKLAHLVEYALLGAHLALSPMLLPTSSRVSYPIAFLFGGVVALLDEGIQHFVPGRGASLSDALIDYVGYLSALLFVFLAFLIFSKIRKGKTHA